LGYGFDHAELGDLPLAIKDAVGVHLRDSAVDLHNFNARFQLLKEGDFSQKWLPALTAGVHYKYNDTISRINDDVGGALHGAGLVHNNGLDFTLYAAKLFQQLPRPVLVELGGRATKAAQVGLLGFTDQYSFVFEGNVILFITDQILLAGEYRQKPSDYRPIGDLVRSEDDWWTIDAAYVVNKHFTLAAGYGHFGNVLNHKANGVWGLTGKWEF
jgi:hypothetical protein